MSPPISDYLCMSKTSARPTVALDSLGCKLNQAEIQQLARQLEAAGPGGLAQIEGVELVLGNDRKMNLLDLLGDTVTSQPSDGPAVNWQQSGRTRAFLKVQSGCKNFCAYCIVPLVRSREENVPLEKGTGLVRGLVGQDGGCVPHFHVSLQIGSDTVLQGMKRRYTTADYRRTVALIRASVPDAAVTTDVIVGFPGETDAGFQESLDFCREMRFARIHVFPFSPRPLTAAATMPRQGSAAIQKERSQKMPRPAAERAQGVQQGLLGKTLDVLWEKQSGGLWSGLTGNYSRVYLKSRENLTNRILPVTLVKFYRDGVWGEVVKTTRCLFFQ